MNASIKISAPTIFNSEWRQKVEDHFGKKSLKLVGMGFEGGSLKSVVVSKYAGHKMEVMAKDLNFSISFE